MAEQFTSLIDSIDGLSLADRAFGLTGSVSECPSSAQPGLVEAIRTLIQSCKDTSVHAQQAKTLVEGTHTPSSQGILKLSSLSRRAAALVRITDTIGDATECYILAYITSLANSGTLVQKMLSHYTAELRNIARDVLNSTGDDSNVLRETLEICYGQGLHTSGRLHSDKYFVPLGEANLEWPYDPELRE
ncbi:hypothetical protein N7478_006881 [Penicillium angulare]|uniref:uncharacterized protein n=1 Tax=Penicillium angulare TaxID=116970 RepID=UPI002540802C|nr:uncharacterized protein N7478_006881 [Penicillium angulare]KAJ5281509.1 hypothetical protein N7478_006881 [Penicillium angulare]